MSRDPHLDDYPDYDSDSAAVGLPGFVLDPVGVIRRRWKWMALVIALGLVLAGVYVKLREPEYLARATVLVASQRISEDFVRSTVETDPLEKVSAILGELLSRRNLVSLVTEFDLFPEVEGAEELPMEEKILIVRKAILIGPDQSNVAVQSPGSSATVFEIQFTANDPHKAADVTNELATGFTDAHLRMRSRQARITTQFLRRELAQTEKELAAQERAITQFKQSHRGELPSELNTSLGRLDRLQSQRQSLALQIASTETRLATLAASGTDVEPQSPEAMLRTLQMRYKEQRALYTEDHPNIVSLRGQIESIEAQIDQEGVAVERGSAAADAARTELRELHRQLEETVAEYEALDRRVAMVPEREEELAAMEQRVEILRESHREFLRKVNQAELSEAVESAQQGERATVLDAAVPPTRPTSSPLRVLAVLLVGSFAAAAGIAILLELIDSVIVSESELEQHYQLPVLGSIPKMG